MQKYFNIVDQEILVLKMYRAPAVSFGIFEKIEAPSMYWCHLNSLKETECTYLRLSLKTY